MERTMTISEVIDLLKQKIKPYTYIQMDQRSFSYIVISIEMERSSISTTKSFFKRFGITGEVGRFVIKENALIKTIPNKH